MATQEELDKSKSQNDNGTFEDLQIQDGDTAEVIAEKNEKAISFAKQNFERAQKAEGKVFNEQTKKWEKPVSAQEEKPAQEQQHASGSDQQAPGISISDLYALQGAKVPEEDVAEVQRYAAYNKISIKEALADPIMKSILEKREEDRNVAAATHTGSSRRGGGGVKTADVLMENASRGELPDSDEEIKELARARKGIKSK